MQSPSFYRPLPLPLDHAPDACLPPIRPSAALPLPPLMALRSSIPPLSDLSFAALPPRDSNLSQFVITRVIRPLYCSPSFESTVRQPIPAPANLHPVHASIHAYVPRGLRHEGGRWLAYRRNYLVVMASASFDLPVSALPNPRPQPSSLASSLIGGGHAFYTQLNFRNQPPRTVRVTRFAISIQAEDEASGKSVALIQHTSKRDAGPQRKPVLEPITPIIAAEAASSGNGNAQTPRAQAGYPSSSSSSASEAIFRNLQSKSTSATSYGFSSSAADFSGADTDDNEDDPYYDDDDHLADGRLADTAVFERIQFKKATANNGRKNTAQQMFRLVTVLYAGISYEDCAGGANVVGPVVLDDRNQIVYVELQRIATSGIIVRGRSPGHYAERGAGRI
ncbi:PhoG like DNA-binding family-domain-containing protein [Myxozyma melibiosi]|uniref:PhoG like DNA-binding family-domain-containing protein n=1 Tax=Myxozyma melibiosi TaxID=54550 RepID=A0ABR1F1U4_9ASCO